MLVTLLRCLLTNVLVSSEKYAFVKHKIVFTFRALWSINIISYFCISFHTLIV